MSVSIEGLCRGSGKVFVKAVMELPEPDGPVTLSCATPDGRPVPCGLYPDGRSKAKATYVAVIPQVTVPLTLSFFMSGVGELARRLLGEKTIDPQSAKWRSRLTYRLDAGLAAEIRDFDAGFAHEHAVIRIDRVILWEGIFKVTGTVEVPCAPDDEIILCCYDADFHDMDARFIIAHEKAKRAWGGRGPYVRQVEFSVDLPNREGNVIFAASVCGEPALDGFAVLEWPVCLRMAEDWFQTHIDAEGDPRYPEWLRAHSATKAELLAQAAIAFDDGPLFSIVVPLYETPLELFDEMVLSVVGQSYGRWELLLVNASPRNAQLQERIDQAVAADARIKEVRLTENGGISLNTRAGIEAASGDFVCFLDHDDAIEPDTLFEYALVIDDDEGADVLYCDEDRLMPSGAYERPIFKPDFSPDLLRSGNYICHFLCMRKGLLATMALPDAALDGAQDYDMALKAFEAGARIRHVPRVLYHWRMAEGSTALDPSAKPYAAQAGIRAVREHLERMGLAADVEHAAFPFTYDVTYRLPEPAPLVSIIIPTKDEAAVLSRCVESIEEITDYPNYEIVLVENNSTEDETYRTYERLQNRYGNISVVRFEGGFNFPRIVNFGAAHARGDVLLFLNNDTEVMHADWLARMAATCCREDVGAVGARLWYPNDTVQHGGVALIKGGASHLQCGAPRGYTGYIALPARMQDLSAVTGACLMVKRALFDEVGGFDEELAVAFNDIDLCLKLRELGKLVVYDPKVELYHHESLSRGYEDDPDKQKRFLRETSLLRGRWARYYVDGDPYYNKNLSYLTDFYQLGD